MDKDSTGIKVTIEYKICNLYKTIITTIIIFFFDKKDIISMSLQVN